MDALPLGVLVDRGWLAVTLASSCVHQATITAIEHVIPRTMTLAEIGASARCRACGRKGCEARPWRTAAPIAPSPAEAYAARAGLLDAILPSKSRRRLR